MTRQDQQKQEILAKHCSALMEHFDSVQILACSHGDGGTKMSDYGLGCYYSRRGMMHEFIERDQGSNMKLGVTQDES